MRAVTLLSLSKQVQMLQERLDEILGYFQANFVYMSLARQIFEILCHFIRSSSPLCGF